MSTQLPVDRERVAQNVQIQIADLPQSVNKIGIIPSSYGEVFGPYSVCDELINILYTFQDRDIQISG